MEINNSNDASVNIVKFLKEVKEEYFDWNISKGPVEIKGNLSFIKNNKNYLFSQQVGFIDSLLEEFNKKPNDNMITKNIAVIGERGSGKTSFLRTFKNSIEENGYFVFDIVDPNILGSSINILEILISLIYSEINNCIDFSNDELLKQQSKILKMLKDISETLSNLRKKDSYFKENNPPIDVLEDINTRIKFNSQFECLLKEFKVFLEYVNSKEIKDIILIIDDLDLIKNKEVYEMLNDIQNFLSGNIILMLGYREEQLLDSVLEEKLMENELLLNKEQIGYDDIKSQSINMIDKLIPYNNRVNLNIENDIFTMDKILKEVVSSGNRTEIDSSILKEIESFKVEDFFEESILYKTNLPTMPVDDKDYTKHIFPENLRGKLQFLELIITEMENHNRNNKPYKVYGKNLKIYKKYFHSTLRNKLDNNKVQIIENWLDTPAKKKNYYMYRALFQEIVKLEKDITGILDINRIQTYNVCIGDVYEILEVYKNIVCKEDIDYYYVYSIKMMYSIELLGYYIAAIESSNDNESHEVSKYNVEENLSNYLKLLNVKIMPENMTYSDSKDHLTIKYRQDFDDFIWKIHYSDLNKSGEIYKNARLKFNPDINKNEENQYKYREFFNYMNLGETTANRRIGYKYKISLDPYAFVGKYKYVSDTIKIGDESDFDYYVFYSMFDIDMFLRLIYTYDDKKGSEKLRSIFNKINKFLGEGDMPIPLEDELHNRIKRYSFKNNYMRKGYNEPYTDREIEKIIEFIKESIEGDRLKTQDIIKELEARIQINNLDGENNFTRSITSLREINTELRDMDYSNELKDKIDEILLSSDTFEEKTRGLSRLYDDFESNEGIKILMSSDNINFRSKNRYYYGLYKVIQNYEVPEDKDRTELEKYVLNLMDYIEKRKGSIERVYEKSIIIMLIALKIENFDSELYRYKEERNEYIR